jgi:hypothetical protein
MNAVHLEAGNTTSLGAPTTPFDAIELDQALREDAPGWMNAIFEEFLAYRRMNTYIIMRGRVLVGRSLLPSRLILRHKFNGKGVVIRKKARLCIRGDKQTSDIDYFETLASVVRYDTFRFFMAKVAAEDLDLDHVDVETVFLNPTLQEEIYMQIPDLLREFLPELKGVEDAYLKLNKLLYSLKQALKEWFYIVKSFFKSIGLKSADADPNLFIGNGVYILLFVDDMLVAGKRQHINVAKAKIIKKWKCKNLGPAEVFIGF